MTNINQGVLDGVRRTGAKVRDLTVDGGLPGAPLGSRMRGATPAGPPSVGTWRAGDTIPDRNGSTWICTTGGTPGTWSRLYPAPAAWFYPEDYGAKGNGQLISDAAITSSANVITTAGVANPSTAPTLATATTLGTILAGTYQVKYTYATAFGETTASNSASQVTTGSTSTITVTAPASNGVPGGAIGVNYYFTAAGGSTYFKQNTTPWPFQVNYIQFTPPSTTTAQPPSVNTTASAPFTAGDVGKSVRVIGAGAAGADLLTTITLYNSPTSVTLAANAGTSVSRNGFVWGTDDTAAIQACLNATDAYAAANNFVAEMVCKPVIYLLATAPTVGGTFGGNCVIQLPAPPGGGPKHKISIRGQIQDVSTLPVYQQMWPETSGTCFMYIGPAGTNNATFGPSSVFGTPTNPNVYVNESGTIPGTVNLKMSMNSVRVVVPWAGGIGGIDLFSAAESANYNCSCQALAIVPTGGSWTVMAANGPTTNQWGWGLREPGAGNNAVSYTEQWTCEGLCYGYGPSEHLVAVDIFTAYCVTGIETYAGNGISMVHNGHILSGGAEFCTNAVGAFDGLVRMDIDNLRTESTSKVIFDTSNRYQGYIKVRDQGAAGQYKSGWANGGANAVLVNLMTTPGPILTPQAAPGSSVAWTNFYYLNAWMTMSLAGGTFISLNMGTVAQPNAVGASTYALTLGAGQSYTAAYTGTLTHTVTLLPT